MNGEKTILRHKPLDRLAHWTVAFTGVMSLLSGLSFMFAPLHGLSFIFGTPQLARILHPFFGVVMCLSLFFLAFRYWHHNHFEQGDLKWMLRIKDVLLENEERIPEVGQYNPGQKLILRQFLASAVLLLVSGIVAWRAYFSAYFDIEYVRLALLTHSAIAALFGISLLIHAYMAYWVEGSIEGMLDGKVSPAWAKQHHPRWYRELFAKKAPNKKTQSKETHK